MNQRLLQVYVNWSAYDELSDSVELTEALAMRQFDELLRLRRLGVRLDAYLMDCFWYARDGGYRTWRTPHWSDQGEGWLEACRRHGVLPGLWIGTNNLGISRVDPLPAWEDSLTADRRSACLFYGGFLPHLLETLALWYGRGVRVFKFDFADLGAAPPWLMQTLLPSEIRAANSAALQAGLARFRATHPATVLLAYNGFEEVGMQHQTDLPLRRSMDRRWLDAFDALYVGDPRPADVPARDFWRSKDVYSDHQVRLYHAQGFPLAVLDNAGFMIGTTGTCYHRGATAWKGMLLLALARGGRITTYYGNLDLLTAEDARWFAAVQACWLDLHDCGMWTACGGLPGRGEPYGWSAVAGDDGLHAWVNPSQAMVEVVVPAGARMVFHDAGCTPVLAGSRLTLAPEQMAVVATGACCGADLGVGDGAPVAAAIRPLALAEVERGDHRIAGTVTLSVPGRVRLILRQRDGGGRARRSSGGAPPDGVRLGTMLVLAASQDGCDLPVSITYDKAIWSGLSWAVGEVDAPAGRLRCIATSAERLPVVLELEAYQVDPGA